MLFNKQVIRPRQIDWYSLPYRDNKIGIILSFCQSRNGKEREVLLLSDYYMSCSENKPNRSSTKIKCTALMGGNESLNDARSVESIHTQVICSYIYEKDNIY